MQSTGGKNKFIFTFEILCGVGIPMCICCMSEVLTNELIPDSKAWSGAGSGR